MMAQRKHHAFFSRVLKEVKKLSITQIIGKYIKVKKNRLSDDDGLCPFHGDTNFGNFKINSQKGIYKCFACGSYGDAIQFVENLFEIGFQPAVMKIAVDQGIIEEEQAEQFLGGKVSDLNIREVANNIREVTSKNNEKVNGLTEIGSPYVLDLGYRLFLKGTTLSPEHRKYLQSRGLTDEEIEKMELFTFPEPTKEFLRALHLQCSRMRLTYNLFKRIPGFYTRPEWALNTTNPATNEREYFYTFARHKGIGIPTRNALGYIVGIQIRKDSLTKKNRYTWFSSSFAGKDDNPFIFGTAAGAPTHVAIPKDLKYKNVVFITEGFFKAEEVARTFGCPCVSVSGVGNYKTICDDLKQIEKHRTFHPIEHLYITFDADLCKNIQVYLHAKNMVNLIRSQYPNVKIYMTLWHEEDGKGIDDLIQNGKDYTLRRTDFDLFVNLYDKMIAELERKYEKYGNVNKIPKEVVAATYNQKVFSKIIAG